MNKEILKRIAAGSRFEVPLFEGAIIVQGRILSPTEAESAGLLTYLLASQITTKQDLVRMEEIRNKALDVNEDSEASQIDQLLFQAKQLGFSPDALGAFREQQNKIICQVVRAGSTDNGETFSKLRLVTAEEQQDPEQNILWIGVLTNEDRETIIDKAMSGHKEASKSIATFCKGQL